MFMKYEYGESFLQDQPCIINDAIILSYSFPGLGPGQSNLQIRFLFPTSIPCTELLYSDITLPHQLPLGGPFRKGI